MKAIPIPNRSFFLPTLTLFFFKKHQMLHASVLALSTEERSDMPSSELLCVKVNALSSDKILPRSETRNTETYHPPGCLYLMGFVKNLWDEHHLEWMQWWLQIQFACLGVW